MTNIPPKVAFTQPGLHSEITAGDTLVAVVSASDPDGSIDRVDFYLNDTMIFGDTPKLIASVTAEPYMVTIQDLKPGHNMVRAVAWDNVGARTGAIPIMVIVHGGEGGRPPRPLIPLVSRPSGRLTPMECGGNASAFLFGSLSARTCEFESGGDCLRTPYRPTSLTACPCYAAASRELLQSRRHANRRTGPLKHEGEKMALKHRHEPQSPESIQAWRELSQLTIRARYTNMRDAATDTLRQAAAADPEGFFTPAYPLWIGDNFEQEGRFEEAAEAFAGVAKQYGDRAVPFAVARIGGLALRRQAESLVRLGRWDDAAASLNAASRYAGGPSGDDLHYELGRIAERAGRRDEALASYRKATGRGNREGSEWSSGELAFRAAARLENPGRYERDPETLASALAGALLRKDEAALRDLASPTHFTIAFGGCEQEFIEYDRVAPVLLRALAESKVKLDPERLTGSGEKRYLSRRTAGPGAPRRSPGTCGFS